MTYNAILQSNDTTTYNRSVISIREGAIMKKSNGLIDVLNSLLEEVLAAKNQNMVHAEMCESWGYKKLQKAFQMQIIDKMRQSEWLIERIIFLKGIPRVSKLNTIIKLGKTVSEMISNEKNEDKDSLKALNNAISLARKIKDQGSVVLLTRILEMEEQHTTWVSMQKAQIEQSGIENYLGNQTVIPSN